MALVQIAIVVFLYRLYVLRIQELDQDHPLQLSFFEFFSAVLLILKARVLWLFIRHFLFVINYRKQNKDNLA